MDNCNVQSSPKLRALNISRNENLGDQPSEKLSLASLAHLEELNMSQCGLSGEFIAQLLACLQSPSAAGIQPLLQKLHLQENPLGVTGFVALLPLITDSCLQVLNLSKCQLGDDAMSKIHAASSLTNKNNLLILDLSYNDISTTGVASLSKALSGNASVLSSLVELNLAGNPLGETGVVGLARALECRHLQAASATYTTRLQKLDLSNTQCGIQGSADIMSLGQLESLLLFNNSLGSNGFRALAPAIRQQHSLLELDLGGNGADETSVVALLSALTAAPGDNAVSNSILKVLVVGGNEGGEEVERMVVEVQQVHPGLDIARDKKAQRRST
jgi:Leucine Rich repeat